MEKLKFVLHEKNQKHSQKITDKFEKNFCHMHLKVVIFLKYKELIEIQDKRPNTQQKNEKITCIEQSQKKMM